MATFGSITPNADKSQNISMGATKGSVTAEASINGYRQTDDRFASAGVNIGVQNKAGGANLQAIHMPGSGQQVTASGHMNLVNKEDIKVSANAFHTSHMPRGGPNFNTKGGGVDFAFKEGGANVHTTHNPYTGRVTTASAHANLFNKNDHSVTANTFHTSTMPKFGPSYNTHGAGVNYAYKDIAGVGASTTHIPAAKMHQHSVNGFLNVHNTPNSSLNVNVGANKTTSPFGNSGWQPGGSLNFKKNF